MRISALGSVNVLSANTNRSTKKTNFKGNVLDAALRECPGVPQDLKEFNKAFCNVVEAVRKDSSFRVCKPDLFNKLLAACRSGSYNSLMNFINHGGDIYDMCYENIVIAKGDNESRLVYFRDNNLFDNANNNKCRGRCIEVVGADNNFRGFGYYEDAKSIYGNYLRCPMGYVDYYDGMMSSGKIKTVSPVGGGIKRFDQFGNQIATGPLASALRAIFC